MQFIHPSQQTNRIKVRGNKQSKRHPEKNNLRIPIELASLNAERSARTAIRR